MTGIKATKRRTPLKAATFNSNAIVSQPSKRLKFMTFREGCFDIHVEYNYLSEALEIFYHHQFYKR